MGASVAIPLDAQVLDLSGRTVIPGLVMVHEHLYYPSGENAYTEQEVSFPRLYLAGGVTTMRTGGSLSRYTDLNIKRAIDAGERPGPAIDVTAPYLEGPGLPILSVKALRDVADARRMVELLGGRGRHVVQGLHAHHARRAGRGGRGSAPRAASRSPATSAR